MSIHHLNVSSLQWNPDLFPLAFSALSVTVENSVFLSLSYNLDSLLFFNHTRSCLITSCHFFFFYNQDQSFFIAISSPNTWIIFCPYDYKFLWYIDNRNAARMFQYGNESCLSTFFFVQPDWFFALSYPHFSSWTEQILDVVLFCVLLIVWPAQFSTLLNKISRHILKFLYYCIVGSSDLFSALQ